MSEQTQEVCDCLETIEANTFKFMSEKVAGEGKISHIHEGDTGFQHIAFFFFGPVGRKIGFKYDFVYTPLKKNGDIGRKKTRTIDIFYAFCPFCGTKYPTAEEEAKEVGPEE